MDFMEKIKEGARADPQRIVFPEAAGDDRTVKAAGIAVSEGIAHPILLGDEEAVRRKAAEFHVDLEGMEIWNPVTTTRMDAYVAEYIEERGVNERIARRLLRRPLYFGAGMVRAGDAGGMVAGALNLTATVVKAGHLVVGLHEGISAPSSFFVMVVPNCSRGEKGIFLFADAGVNPDPTVEELAEIAICSARSARTLLGWQPRVAMLSFSTKGSASHARTRKVVEATELARTRDPDLLIDGELQVDSAIVPEVAARKIKGDSPVAGRGNVLIFPDLDAANIGYKLTQYLAGAQAFGPLLQGFVKPINDLSRGASIEDIVGVIAVTSVEASRGASRA